MYSGGSQPTTAQPGAPNCTENFFSTRIDKVTSVVPPGGNTTFPQRWFAYEDYWSGPGGPIWFYTGE